jgi:uncharacterized protein involved in exopolysaccharide biosynthesis
MQGFTEMAPLSFSEGDFQMEQPQGATFGTEFSTEANETESISVGEVDIALNIRIARFLRLCWVRRRIFFGTIGTGILLSLLYTLSLPKMYTSTTTLMPPDSTSSSSNLVSLLSNAGPAASVGSAALGIKTPGAVFVGILGSRTVQESLVTRFDLIRYYKTILVEDACKRLAADTHIVEDTKNGIIRISVNAKNPMLASNIAQGYVTELDRVVNNNSTSSARRERIFLEERLKEIKQDLDDSAEALSLFSTKSRTIEMPTQARAMVDAGLKLQGELTTARSDLAGLRQTYSEDNVRVRTASARVEELQRQMDKITGLSQNGGPMVDTRESDYPSLGELPALGLTYADLDRKVLVEEALWEALTKQYEAAKVQEAKDIPTVRILDVANIPQHKSSPARAIILIVGTMFSILAAIIIIILSSFWDKVNTQDEWKKLMEEIIDSTRYARKHFGRPTGME